MRAKCVWRESVPERPENSQETDKTSRLRGHPKTHPHTHRHTHTISHTQTSPHTHTYSHTHTHIDTHTLSHTRRHPHTHTYTHTHTAHTSTTEDAYGYRTRFWENAECWLADLWLCKNSSPVLVQYSALLLQAHGDKVHSGLIIYNTGTCTGGSRLNWTNRRKAYFELSMRFNTGKIATHAPWFFFELTKNSDKACSDWTGTHLQSRTHNSCWQE